MKDREVWFRRVFLWASVPIHWKGVILLIVTVAVGVGGCNLAAATGHPGTAALCLLGSALLGWTLAERHTE